MGGICVYCGGDASKASFLTYSEFFSNNNTWSKVTNASGVFGPHDASDSWGTEDPRMKFNPQDKLYYMFYTAYNGTSILLNLATSPNPTSPDEWYPLPPAHTHTHTH